MLASDGLVTTLPQRGHVVNAVSLAEVLDAFHLREVLEADAVAQAAARITPAEIEHLRCLAETRESRDMPAVNLEFHTSIARASGNRLLVDFIGRLLLCMQRVLILDPHLTAWTEEGYQEEMAIVEALAARDAAAAREAMIRHVRNTMASVLRQSRSPA